MLAPVLTRLSDPIGEAWRRPLSMLETVYVGLVLFAVGTAYCQLYCAVAMPAPGQSAGAGRVSAGRLFRWGAGGGNLGGVPRGRRERAWANDHGAGRAGAPRQGVRAGYRSMLLNRARIAGLDRDERPRHVR